MSHELRPDTLGAAFADSEGDRYFERNRQIYAQRAADDHDGLIKLLQLYNLRPQRAIEIGCANGYRLERLRQTFGTEVWGIDLSKTAIADGQERFPEVHLQVASATQLPSFDDAGFDLVLSSGLLYVIDRIYLMRTLSEMDRLLSDGGHLILSEVNSVLPSRLHYHHLSAQYQTYKQDYSQVFLASQLYFLVHQSSSHYNDLTLSSTNDYQCRYSTWLMRKDLKGLYQEINFNPSLNA